MISDDVLKSVPRTRLIGGQVLTSKRSQANHESVSQTAWNPCENYVVLHLDSATHLSNRNWISPPWSATVPTRGLKVTAFNGEKMVGPRVRLQGLFTRDSLKNSLNAAGWTVNMDTHIIWSLMHHVSFSAGLDTRTFFNSMALQVELWLTIAVHLRRKPSARRLASPAAQ